MSLISIGGETENENVIHKVETVRVKSGKHFVWHSANNLSHNILFPIYPHDILTF